jgi:hypothetical protein
MAKSISTLLFYLLICLIAIPTYAQKEVKITGAQGRWQVSDDITLKTAEERALMEAKKDALRKAGVMENVWSVFGQITQDGGTEFQEAYSQMNVLAIGGMLNITKQKVEDVWDANTRSLYKVATIDATVQTGQKVDKTYVLDVKGISTLYQEGDAFTCRLKVHGSDSYLKFFWFDSRGGALFYPNTYEPNALLAAGREYNIPFNNAIEYRLEKGGKDGGKINLMLVATKDNIPFTGEVTYQSVLSWIYAIPNDRRCAFYDMLLIK